MTKERMAWVGATGALVLTTALAVSGCKQLAEAFKDSPLLPSAAMARVDLVQQPSFDELMSYSCFEWVGGGTCGLFFGSQPAKRKMKFSFDVVFDLFNPNAGFAIPLVEMLLATTVFEDENLGALCVSFCDPEAEDCAATANAEKACRVDEADHVDGIDDFVPTFDDMLELAEDVVDGTLDDSFYYRTIPKYSELECQDKGTSCTEDEVDGVPNICCDGACTPLEPGCTVGKNDKGRSCGLCDGHTEAHIQFDFDIDTMLSLMETLLTDAVDDIISGRTVNLAIPYTMDGTLFFDIPGLGRKAIGFGPWEDRWNLVD